jgi:hypothetical protein
MITRTERATATRALSLPPADDAVVGFTQERVGTGSGYGDLTKHSFEVGAYHKMADCRAISLA